MSERDRAGDEGSAPGEPGRPRSEGKRSLPSTPFLLGAFAQPLLLVVVVITGFAMFDQREHLAGVICLSTALVCMTFAGKR